MLHVIDDVVFYDQRIGIPKSLQPQTLNLIHESHFGIEKCKSRARELVYWPSVNADIERIVKSCELCIKYQNNQKREPMILHTILNERFLKVGIDIMTFQAKDYLVIVHYYSKYPELQCLSDKTASTIIEQCKRVFARHGIPVEIVSDNTCRFKVMNLLRFPKLGASKLPLQARHIVKVMVKLNAVSKPLKRF